MGSIPSPVESAATVSLDKLRKHVASTIDTADTELHKLNKEIHSHPELCYKEFFAVKTICEFLEAHGHTVTRETYSLETSFTSEVGSGGPLVIICAEYDALPNIGHACGHNLIATSSIASYLAVAACIKQLGIPGRVRLLGTPAEEGGGGKVKLIEAGAFDDKEIVAAIMCHPLARHNFPHPYSGLAGLRFIASYKFRVEFRGKPAHAAGEPWNGVNALDAAVAMFNNISLLRQAMRPDERVHGVFEDGGTVPNVITDYTRMNWYVRSPSMKRAKELLDKTRKCAEAAALATGCEYKYIDAPTYKDLRINGPLSQAYADEMAHIGEKIIVRQDECFTASTDMGNVSYAVPSFHGAFGIVTEPGVSQHHPDFAKHAGEDGAHREAIKVGKGMALLALRVLIDRKLQKSAMDDFNILPAE